MPKTDAKKIQRELSAGNCYPLYWIYGPETFLIRETSSLIEKELRQSAPDLVVELLDGGHTVGDLIERLQSFSLFGAKKLVIVRSAHEIKNLDALAGFLGPAASIAELPAVAILISKDLDARKKFSKLLLEKAAVVECPEIRDDDKETWIGYLAKRRELNLSASQVGRLRTLDPWSLDLVSQELEKLSLYLLSSPQGRETLENDPLLSSDVREGGAEAFIDAFFQRQRSVSLEYASQFANQTEETLPLLGLLAWNVRHLIARPARLNPYLAQKFSRWTRHWDPSDLQRLHHRLSQIDFATKQKPLHPLGLWTGLVLEFCQ